jgi:hypothetical protein
VKKSKAKKKKKSFPQKPDKREVIILEKMSDENVIFPVDIHGDTDTFIEFAINLLTEYICFGDNDNGLFSPNVSLQFITFSLKYLANHVARTPQDVKKKNNAWQIKNPIDFTIKYKTTRLSMRANVDLVQFSFQTSRAIFKKYLHTNYSSYYLNIDNFFTYNNNDKKFNISKYIKFINPTRNVLSMDKVEKIATKGDCIVLVVNCPSSCLLSSFIMFGFRNPEMIEYLKTDNPIPNNMYKVITKGNNECIAIVNFGFFYLFKAETLQWMPPHSFRSEILFEAYTRCLSSKLFEPEMQQYKQTLELLKLNFAMKATIFSILKNGSGENVSVTPNKFFGMTIGGWLANCQIFRQLPILLELHRFSSIKTNEKPGVSAYEYFLNEVYRSYKSEEMYQQYLKTIFKPNSLSQVTFLEVLKSFTGSFTSDARLTNYLIRNEAFTLLFKSMSKQLKKYMKFGDSCGCLTPWFSNDKFILFYRILETLYIIRHHYHYFDEKYIGEKSSDLSKNSWVIFRAPILLETNRSYTHKNCKNIYDLFYRFNQNINIHASLTDSEKRSSSFSRDSSEEYYDDFEGAKPINYISSQIATNLLSKDSLIDNEKNDLYRSEFGGGIIDDESARVVATATLDLSVFRSFTTKGLSDFEKAIADYELHGTPLKDNQTKEELFVDHILAEFLEIIMVHKTIADCTTSSILLNHAKTIGLKHPAIQKDIKVEDRSSISLEKLFSGCLDADLKTPVFNFGSGEEMLKDFVAPINMTSKKEQYVEAAENRRLDDNRKLTKSGAPRKKRIVKEGYGQKQSLLKSKKHWLKSMENKRYLRGVIRSKGYISFDKFVSILFHPYGSKDDYENFGIIMTNFLVTTFYDLILNQSDKLLLTVAELGFIIENFIQVPSNKRRNRQKTNGNNNMDISEDETVSYDVEDKKMEQETNEEVGLDQQHKVIITKIKQSFTNSADQIDFLVGEKELDDKNLRHQASVVSKYDNMVKFVSKEDTGFTKFFEPETYYDLNNEMSVKIINHWKEFLKIALCYTFSESDLDNLEREMKRGYTFPLFKGEDDDFKLEIIQVLDNSNVELIPTIDSSKCFNKPVKYITNMDKKSRVCTTSNGSVSTSVGYIVSYNNPGSISTAEIEYINQNENSSSSSYEDEPYQINIRTRGNVLYDDDSFYISTTGVTKSITIYNNAEINQLSSWVNEFLVVDLFNLWKSHVN